jgi:phosphoglycerol transferase MdoB-like AlkP superfamily enzyme
VLPGDLLLGDQVFHNAEFFAHYTGRHLVLLLLAALLFVAVLWVIWRAERHSLRLRWLPRLLWLLVSLVALVTLYRGDGAWQKVYADKALPGFYLWSPMASVKKVGFVAEFARMAQESRVRLPSGEQELVANFAEQHADDLRAATTRKPPTELPDIVVVQSEAFFDPGILKAVDPGEFVPNFERLAATGISGSLTTPAYGGGTIRTEFEALTGYPMAAFPAISYPYFGLARQWMPSVPHRLEEFGYSTVLFHPFLADFWNRKGVMPALGFQHTYYAEKFVDAKRAGIYVSDHSLFDFVLAHLDEHATHPQYVLAITMENHGPWNADAGALTSVLSGKSLPTALSAKGRREMTYYLSHLVNGDRALGDFAKRLLARPRWTILMFYGDHLPALPHAFARLGFDDDGPDIAQHTRYMLLSNRALTPHKLDLNAYDLPGLLFDVVGLPEDGYLALASAIRRAWAQDNYQHGPEYGQVQFNAAQLEVACRHKLDAAGKCGVRTSGEKPAPKPATDGG